MLIVLFCSLIALLLTFLESVGKMKNGMKWGFVLITILACLHYNYGNDYMSYYDVAETVRSTPFNLDAVLSGEVYREPGWTLLNYLFLPLGGFFTMVAVLNIIQNLIVYRFIKQHVSIKWQPVALFFYLFSTNFYLMNFSMMRQGLVICVFLGLWPWISQKKVVKSLLVLSACTLIHHSSAILLPFAFWGYLKLDRPKTAGFIFSVLLLLFWLNGELLNNMFSFIVDTTNMSNYIDTYDNGQKAGSKGLGFFIYQIPTFVTLAYFFHANNRTKEEVSMVTLAVFGIMVSPFTQALPMVGRVGIYFSIYMLAVVPFVFSLLSRKLMICTLSLYILITLYDYYLFFKDPGWFLYFGQFHTIFEAL